MSALQQSASPQPEQRRYTMEQLKATTLNELTHAQAKEFYTWIESMTPAVDNEEGVGFATWLKEHAQTAGDKTYVFFDRATDQIVATGSLIRKDRDIAADENGWMMGGVNVHRDIRQQGIGTAVCNFIDQEVQREADQTGKVVPVKLFTNFPPAIKIYERFGYRRFEAPDVANYTGGDAEQQYRRDYAPISSESLADLKAPPPIQ